MLRYAPALPHVETIVLHVRRTHYAHHWTALQRRDELEPFPAADAHLSANRYCARDVAPGRERFQRRDLPMTWRRTSAALSFGCALRCYTIPRSPTERRATRHCVLAPLTGVLMLRRF